MFALCVIAVAAVPASAAQAAAATHSTAAPGALRKHGGPSAVASVLNQEDPNAITFDDYPVGTTITNEYASRGVIFDSEVFTSTDLANPTAPVLSGTPLFFGDIVGHFTIPGTATPTTVDGFSLDVGYIDDRNSVEIDYYDIAGNLVGSTRAQAYGINEIDVAYRGVASFKVSAVEYEAAGFAIDNLVIRSGASGIHPTRMAELGDSYSSGEGLVPDKSGLEYDCGTDLQENSYFKGTNVPAFSAWGPASCQTATGSKRQPKDLYRRDRVTYENLCHRHRRAYPNQIREQLGIPSEEAIFVACSGATTADVLTRAQYPNSPARVHGGQPQLKTVEDFATAHGEPELVTIGIGGNDAGFGGIVRHCAIGLTSCADPGYEQGVIAKVYGTMYDNVVSALTALTIAFPNATIAAFGYTSVIDDPAQACVPGIDANEMSWLKYGLLPAVNDAIKDAATETGVTYIDITAATAGHGVCSAEPWINGIRLGNDRIWGWIPKGVANESIHPNQKAHDAIAAFFMTHYTDGNGNLTFTNSQRQAPIRVAGAPELTAGEIEAGAMQRCGSDCRRPAPCIQACSINIQGSGFDPGAVMNVTLHSEPVVLGQVTADEEGNVEGAFPAPRGTAPGLHLVTLEGAAPDGTVQDGVAQFRVYKGTRTRLVAKLRRRGARVRIRSLKVKKAPSKSRIDIVCVRGGTRNATRASLGGKVRRGGGCPFRHRHFRLKAKGKRHRRGINRDFGRLFKRSLAPHTRVRIVFSKRSLGGRSLDVVVRKGRKPKLIRRCTDPGTVVPTGCRR